MIRHLLIALCAAAMMLPACSSSHSSQSFKYKKYKVSRGKGYAKSGWRTQRKVMKSHPRVGKLPRSDIPLVVNPRVVKWIDFWTGRARGSFTRYMQRSGRFMDMFRERLRQKGMPEDLVYIALIESGFRNDAKSWASAVGTWQFIRSTGRLYGLKIGEWVDERRDPELAVEAAANYFSDLYEEFGDWYLAMAAYNGGPGRVKQAIRKYKSTDFWDLTRDGRNVFRDETKNYVPKYIAAAILAKNPERFGFRNIQYHAPLNYEQVVVHGQTDLDIIAKAAGAPIKSITELNPELHAGATPPGKYTVQVPVGAAHKTARNFRTVAKKHGGKTVRYRVKRGDTLSHIASRHGVSLRKLKSANGLRSNRIRRGKMLRVPGTRMAGKKIEVVGSSVKIAKARETQYEQIAQAQGRRSDGPQYHRVRRGDSVRKIAKHYKVNSKDVREWNGLKRFGKVRPGQVLRLQAPETQQPLVVSKAAPMDVEAVYKQVQDVRKSEEYAEYKKPKYYRVRRGDVLSTIARRHGMSVKKLKSLNGLRGDRIRVGQRLAVSKSSKTQVAKKSSKSAERSATSYRVKRGDTLSVIARRNGLAVRDLRAWNDLKGNTIKVGQSLSLRPKRLQPKNMPTYTVRSGDSLGLIAEKHKMSVRELQRVNQMGRSTRIRAGQKLKVSAVEKAVAPQAKPTVVAQKPATPTTEAAATTTVTTPATTPAAKATPIAAKQPQMAVKPKEVQHTVRAGDTLWDISREYDVDPEEIKVWNGMKSAKIKPGQNLTIRTKS